MKNRRCMFKRCARKANDDIYLKVRLLVSCYWRPHTRSVPDMDMLVPIRECMVAGKAVGLINAPVFKFFCGLNLRAIDSLTC